MILPYIIFIATILAVMARPFKIKVGTSAIIGAAITLAFGLVSWDDLITIFKITSDATLTLIGLIIISLILDSVGFFEFCALFLAKLAGASAHLLFFAVMIFTAIIAALFANDGAILILTPIIIAKMRLLCVPKRALVAFLLATGFMSDSASLPFVFSNLTNIITAGYFEIGFRDYLGGMLAPFLASVATSALFSWLLLRRDIPSTISPKLLPSPLSAVKSRFVFIFGSVFIVVLLGGYFLGDFLGLPVSVFALGGAMVLLVVATASRAIKPLNILKEAPWQVIWFSIGLYIVVFALKNAGLAGMIAHIIAKASELGDLAAILTTGFLSAFSSAIANNLPTNMLFNIAIKDSGDAASELLAYANIIGSNIGSKMTPFGSLATLLWLFVLSQKGIKISVMRYIKFGFLMSVLVSASTLFALYIGV